MNSEEHIKRGEKSQFKAHWQAFLDKAITLKQLESICFSWIIQHENLYQEKPLPTEPIDMGKVSAIKYLEMKKAWEYYCSKIVVENKSNKDWLEDAKNFFLNEDYDEGIKLFNKYKNYEKKPNLKPEQKEKPDNDEVRNLFINEMEKTTKKNVEQASACPF